MSNGTCYIYISVIPEKDYYYKLSAHLKDNIHALCVTEVTKVEQHLFGHIYLLLHLSNLSNSDKPHDAIRYACQLIFDDLSSVARYYVIKINNTSAVLFETKAWEGEPPEITDENSSTFIDLLPVRKSIH
jgi:hypothetical protein